MTSPEGVEVSTPRSNATRGLAFAAGSVHEAGEIEHRARQAIKLGDDQRVGPSMPQGIKGGDDPRPVEVPATEAGILHESQISLRPAAPLGFAKDRSSLGIEAGPASLAIAIAAIIAS